MPTHRPGPHRLLQPLQRHLALIRKLEVLARDSRLDHIRDQNPVRRRRRLQPLGDIDGDAMQVITCVVPMRRPPSRVKAREWLSAVVIRSAPPKHQQADVSKATTTSPLIVAADRIILASLRARGGIEIPSPDGET